MDAYGFPIIDKSNNSFMLPYTQYFAVFLPYAKRHKSSRQAGSGAFAVRFGRFHGLEN
jgi:hypothetical protein